MAASCLVLSNGVIGAEKQALALARAVGLPTRVTRVTNALHRLPTSLQLAAAQLFGAAAVGAPPHAPPALAISCGRATVPASIALRDAGHGRTLTVHVQRPPCDPRLFDLIIAPRHDYSAQAVPPNVCLTDGSLHSITPEAVARARDEWASSVGRLPSPRLALLVGGEVSRRPWQRALTPPADATRLEALAASACEVGAPPLAASPVAPTRRVAVQAARAARGSLLFSCSRRTPGPARAAATEQIRLDCLVYEGGGTNPYLGYLAYADFVIVTPDSINMVSEACALGTPHHLYAWHVFLLTFVHVTLADVELWAHGTLARGTSNRSQKSRSGYIRYHTSRNVCG
ncbi:hypothetical protein AB1Y20_010106 [Prymnesium parvum]|uniref:Lipid-A-disaccharide synthase n=1 Tax=Prymnesium parvum TaxID=97485 RepID=A0AB34K327_PRYPA